FQEAVRTLNSLQSNALTLERCQITAAKRLQNMVDYIHRSGLTVNDLDKLSIIHISGTKGKGSTAAYCESILRHEGYKTAFFSSPHLVEVRERFRINGKPISKELFTSNFWHVYNKLDASKESYDNLMPPYFAFLTVLSCHIFLEEKVDVTIMEVGVGGEYDSTNFIKHPIVCGVTSLGLDHTTILGKDLASIAWNKAGIFKEGVPAVTVEQPPEAMKVIHDRSVEKNVSMSEIKDVTLHNVSQDIKLGINGDKQIVNASLAVQLCKIWKQTHSGKDPVPLFFPISTQVYNSLKECIWYGRNQTIQRPGITYYLDGAHTLESVQQCVDWFNESSTKEAKAVKGKVVKILVFNLTGGRGRDVSILLNQLQRCNFNGALFTPNLAYSAIDPNHSGKLSTEIFQNGTSEHFGTSKLGEELNGAQNELFVVNGEALDMENLKYHTHILPCISSALFWATQGKDKCVNVEKNCVVPDIPSEFHDASHIQILITGSLHLVGGALSIVMPNLND
ncbi:hypothetical protein LOTGIDRAFT_129379, partial [Lottia gigantea]